MRKIKMILLVLAIISFLSAFFMPAYFRLINACGIGCSSEFDISIPILLGISTFAITLGIVVIVCTEKLLKNKQSESFRIVIKLIAFIGIIIGFVSITPFLYLKIVDPGIW